MIFTLTDRNYNPLDIYETDDYLIGKYTGSILETLDINVEADDERSQFWQRGNYIMCRPSDGKNRWFTILDDEDGLNDDDKVLSCYSGTLDIISEEYPGISATQAQPFEWYFNAIFGDTGIVLGINELAGQERKLEYTSQNVTNAEMLQYVLNGFDNAEAGLEVEFDGTVPQKIILNVYKRIGEVEPQVVLSDEDDSLTDLTRKGSISQLGTSLLCFGAEEEEQKVSLIGKEFVEKDADGNILYISYKESPRIYSIKGRENYYVQLPGKADGRDYGYINRTYSSEAKTQDELWQAGLAKLKQIDHAIVEYEAKGDIDCGIGDNVQIVSHTMNPPVMISARVTEYKFNDDDPSRKEYKFSNFTEIKSNMDDLTSIINKIKDQIVYVIDQSVTYCLAEQGTTAPVTGWTNVNPGAVKGKWLWTRTETIFSNGETTVTEIPVYSAIDGENGRGIIGTPETVYGQSKLGTTMPGTWSTTRPDVPAGEYLWTKTITKYTDNTESSAIIPTLMGPKGDDGLPAYVHNAWAWSPDGTVDFTTVYPNENLFTMDMIHPTPNTAGAIVSGNTVTYSSGGWATAFMSNARLRTMLSPDTEYSVQYTFQLLSKASGTVPYRQNAHGSILLYSGVTGYPSIDLGQIWLGNYEDAKNWVVGTEKVRKSTFKTPANLYDEAANYRIIYYTMRSMNSDGTFNTYEKGKFYNIKFEESPSPTIYTPSPIDDPIGAYMKYMGTCSNHSETAPTDPNAYHWEVDPTYLEYSKVGGDQYDSDQSEIYELIGGKADSEEFQALKREADALLESYNSFVSEGGKYEQDLENIENRAIGLIEQLNDKIAQFEFIKTYIRMGEEGLEIGAQDSTMKMLLTKDSLSFMDGGKVVAYFTQQSFYINRGAIVESLQLGNFKFSTVNDDLLVLQYVGG